MELIPYYLGCLSHASYMVGDDRTKLAVVIDPQRDIDGYLADARKKNWKIAHVLLTHFHADFVSGHLELEKATDATIHIGRVAKAEFKFEPMVNGESLKMGDVRFSFLETPGHTPEGVSIVVYDRTKSETHPEMVFTGDTLFIGDVGRPDLMASVGVTAKDLAENLYDSLHDKILQLPDETLVYPAHGAGSMCGKSLSNEKVSTIGKERKFNYALAPMSKPEFVRLITAEQPDAPAYFAYDADLNRRNRPTLQESIKKALRPLTVAEGKYLIDQGAQVVDTREPDEFAQLHWRGSINIGLGGRYASWAGMLLDRTKPILILAAGGKEEESILRLGRIGFDQVQGFIQGGIKALEKHPEWIAKIDRISSHEADRLRSLSHPVVLDVRGESEWKVKHLEESQHIPLNHLSERINEIPRDRPIAILCGSGYRSSIAASLLEGAGYRQLIDLAGGFPAWEMVPLKSS